MNMVLRNLTPIVLISPWFNETFTPLSNQVNGQKIEKGGKWKEYKRVKKEKKRTDFPFNFYIVTFGDRARFQFYSTVFINPYIYYHGAWLNAPERLKCHRLENMFFFLRHLEANWPIWDHFSLFCAKTFWIYENCEEFDPYHLYFTLISLNF